MDFYRLNKMSGCRLSGRSTKTIKLALNLYIVLLYLFLLLHFHGGGSSQKSSGTWESQEKISYEEEDSLSCERSLT